MGPLKKWRQYRASNRPGFRPFEGFGRHRWPCQLLLLVGLAALSGCDKAAPAPLEISGVTMGTTYSIKFASSPGMPARSVLQTRVDRRLDAIERIMSTWNPESELMKVNRSAADGCIEISPELAEVVGAALEIARLTGGGFDITVGPLVNLWGFGPDMEQAGEPSPEQIAAAMARVGYRRLSLSGLCLQKTRPDLLIDLSGIAKGYAVDEIAGLLERAGIEHFMVEIGGELRARGQRDGREPWRIGIEKPVSDRSSVQKVIPLSNLSLATSGDYRNYFERDGLRYSHLIDAASGRPVRHELVSVTVAHESCMWADALATAIMVLGAERGMRLAEREGLAVIAIADRGGQLHEIESARFAALH